MPPTQLTKYVSHTVASKGKLRGMPVKSVGVYRLVYGLGFNNINKSFPSV